MADQPEALRLADELDYKEQRFLDPYPSELRQAAAELRRLRAVNRELLEALLRIATVNAMDYEYQAWARAAIAKAEGEQK